MKKNTIIYIVSTVIALVIISIGVYFAIQKNNNKNESETKNITIIKYNKDNGSEKIVEIKKKKDINKLSEICNNISLEQDETTKGFGIKMDIEIDLQNGTKLYLQEGLEDYCAYSSKDINYTIKMPEGLVDFVNNALKD